MEVGKLANRNPDTSGLVSLADRTNNERTKIQSLGGLASGVARRKKNKMRQILTEALLLPHEDQETRKEAIAVALINRALSGDVKAFEMIMKFIGEMPTELQQMATDDELSAFTWGKIGES